MQKKFSYSLQSLLPKSDKTLNKISLWNLSQSVLCWSLGWGEQWLQWRKRICLLSWSFLFFSYTPIPRSSRTNTNWKGHWGLSCYASWVTNTCHTTMTTIYQIYIKYIPNIIINVKVLDFFLPLVVVVCAYSVMSDFVIMLRHVTLWSHRL